ncbi:alpha-amylase family glycosyl hydrolase [Aliiglaciecola lipolytica]|uniref:Alpha-amylase, putative n=1 Tax=Aliiglaciecola lipolytica E3 TaxID=1127673 RepID=K6YQF0_9ALTE|nr:alpha-amylase family glycosyl hydrolase [Aliiglaciecola lipolytica]GAC13560.1 alpha-amylase, putative [Aliiglaciecola lipolytica E3]
MPIDHSPKQYMQIVTPDWAKDAVIYQINTRQFTTLGTFNAAQSHFPRLKTLGVDILWIMPIHPIGEKNRKGTLGSPYAVKDYMAVNPEFGDLTAFQDFVSTAHSFGFKVIIDWVCNHSAWDNPLVASHPDWYARDYKGDFTPTPWWDWDDVIDFDYSQKALREYMAMAMRYWVEVADIDGFRCDVAGFVPNDFWSNVRADLDAIKPVFMLAEWESKDLHQNAFDMTYAWSWNEIMHDITCNGQRISKLFKYYSWNEKSYPAEAHRMTFVSNHDKNAWDGTQFEQFKEGLEAAIVLSVIGEGMPLIHNGQEAGETKRLAFFEKDPIHWQAHYIGDLYEKLIALKKSHTALHNAQWGARMIHVPNNQPTRVFSFVRRDSNSQIFVVLNLSDIPLQVSFEGSLFIHQYDSFFEDKKVVFSQNAEMALMPWGYQVYVSNE